MPGYSMPQNAIVSCVGPLCHSVDDIKRYCKSLWSDNFFEQNLNVPPIHFREQAFDKTVASKLKIGYLCYKSKSGQTLYGLENCPVSKGTSRAIQMTIDKLREAGHTLVEFTISQQDFDEM